MRLEAGAAKRAPGGNNNRNIEIGCAYVPSVADVKKET